MAAHSDTLGEGGATATLVLHRAAELAEIQRQSTSGLGMRVLSPGGVDQDPKSSALSCFPPPPQRPCERHPNGRVSATPTAVRLSPTRAASDSTPSRQWPASCHRWLSSHGERRWREELRHHANGERLARHRGGPLGRGIPADPPAAATDWLALSHNLCDAAYQALVRNRYPLPKRGARKGHGRPLQQDCLIPTRQSHVSLPVVDARRVLCRRAAASSARRKATLATQVGTVPSLVAFPAPIVGARRGRDKLDSTRSKSCASP